MPANNLQGVKRLLSANEIQGRFREILGQKAPQFMASIVNAVAGNPKLRECDPNSVLAAALVAATYDLPIDNNLGFAAIVPYKGKAQFQIMFKGLIQLAIRSGYYEKMNCADVYEDELVSYNPITGEMTFVSDFSRCTQRAEGREDKIIGYFAWFRLKTGFAQELYMSRADVDNHARKYSQSYRYDLNAGRQSSRWTTDFHAMARKTVIKQLLSRWGVLSIDMQRSMLDDQKVYNPDGTTAYADNPAPAVKEPEPAVDVFAQPAPDAKPLPEPPQRAESAEAAQAGTTTPPEQTIAPDADFAAFDAQFEAAQSAKLPL